MCPNWHFGLDSTANYRNTYVTAGPAGLAVTEEGIMDSWGQSCDRPWLSWKEAVWVWIREGEEGRVGAGRQEEWAADPEIMEVSEVKDFSHPQGNGGHFLPFPPSFFLLCTFLYLRLLSPSQPFLFHTFDCVFIWHSRVQHTISLGLMNS